MAALKPVRSWRRERPERLGFGTNRQEHFRGVTIQRAQSSVSLRVAGKLILS